jgi:hypothetical protein
MGLASAASCSSSSGGSSAGSGSSGDPNHPLPDGQAGDGFVVPPDGGLLDVDSGKPPPPLGDGRVVVRLPDTRWHRLLAKVGSSPEDVSIGMDKISAGSDSFVNVSKDGDWLVASGSRFSCGSGSCLVIFSGDLSKGEAVLSGGTAITTGEGRPAVASGGNVVVYPAGGPHPMDLYALKRTGGVWGTPVLLTGASSFDYHHDVAIAWDGSRVVFDCGADKYGAPPTSLCEVATDGSGFHEVLGPTDPRDALHHPDYTPEGDIVFETNYPAELVFKLARGASQAMRISPADESNDNSPCVLPDGRIVSLWLGRPGNTTNAHEIKVMNADGSGTGMLLTDVDVVDIGMGCGN